MADHPRVHPVDTGADQKSASPDAGEDEAEGLGRRHQPAAVSRVHRGVAILGWEGGEDPRAARVVEGEQPHARRAGGPPGDMGKGAAEPAIPVVEDDQRALRGIGQADMLRNSGVTSASTAS